MCLWMFVCMGVHVWRPVVDVSVFLSLAPSYFFDTVSPTEPGTHRFTWTSWPRDPWNVPISALHTEVAGIQCYAQLLLHGFTY